MPLIMELLVLRTMRNLLRKLLLFLVLLVSQGYLLECLGLRWMLVMVKKLPLVLVLSVGPGLHQDLDLVFRKLMLRKGVFFLMLLMGQ